MYNKSKYLSYSFNAKLDTLLKTSARSNLEQTWGITWSKRGFVICHYWFALLQIPVYPNKRFYRDEGNQRISWIHIEIHASKQAVNKEIEEQFTCSKKHWKFIMEERHKKVSPKSCLFYTDKEDDIASNQRYRCSNLHSWKTFVSQHHLLIRQFFSGLIC